LRYQYTPVPVEVAPLFVTGLNGKRAQYFAIDCDILRLVSALWWRPLFAAAILSFCACGISLRHILLIIVIILLLYCFVGLYKY
jgi:hypothetical protein